jgi:NitT/TauT family transport system ATP-binding protein
MTQARGPQPASGPSAPPPIIEACDLGKTFLVNGNALIVFEGLSCQIQKGSFVSVVGPSGCGKSTLLKLMSGLEMPTHGEVRFNGRVVAGPAKGMIYVFQQYTKSIFPWRTVIENVAFGINRIKAPGKDRLGVAPGRREAHERCREYVRLVGLEGFENHYPYQLSGGMQQRVCIARALISEPDVLLMDEPFSAVDALTRALLQDLILRVWETIPVTIVFVTHDVEEAIYLSGRIVSLSRSPAEMREDLAIDLPYPRDQIRSRESERFTAYRHRLFSSVFMQEKAGPAGARQASDKVGL